MKGISYLRISLAAQLLLAIYFQMIIWFSLGLWNYQPGFVPLLSSDKIKLGNIVMVNAYLLPFLIFSFAYWRQWKWLMWAGTIGYGVWLYLQFQTWWIPYLFGASPHWQEIYNRVFAHSTKILPSFGNHLAPDAMHLTIQLLLIIIVISSTVGLVKLQRRKKSSL
jgi:hypothetical protein